MFVSFLFFPKYNEILTETSKGIVDMLTVEEVT